MNTKTNNEYKEYRIDDLLNHTHSVSAEELDVEKETIARFRSEPLSASELVRLDNKTIRSSAMDIIEATAPIQEGVECVTRKRVIYENEFHDSLSIDLINGDTIYIESKECTYSEEDPNSICKFPTFCWE